MGNSVPALGDLEQALCRSLCASIRIHTRPDGYLFVETPFTFADGDVYSVLLKPLPNGGFRVTDAGQTLMHLSYRLDVDKILSGTGTRAQIFARVLAESGAQDAGGEIFVEATAERLGEAVFSMAQAITRVTDLSFLSRARAASTFYDDLYEELCRLVPSERIQRDYVVPDVPRAADYPVDFRLSHERPAPPLYVFGVPNREKARLATIILQHLLAHRHRFDSLLVFQNQEELPRPDLARLTNVGGEMVASLDARDDLSRKVLNKVA